MAWEAARTHAHTHLHTSAILHTFTSFQLAVESGELASFLLALETALDQVAVRIFPTRMQANMRTKTHVS